MRVESPSSPRERRSVSTVRRSIIFMRDSNFIKKDGKCIPHFRRIVPYFEWGRNTRREVGGTILPCQGTAVYFFHTSMMKLLSPPSLYLVGMCNAFTFVSRGNIKNGGGGESGGSARFPHSERGFSGVKPRCEKFHKKTIFCGQIVIDNNILLWYDCRAFFGEDDNFRPELP